MQFVEVFFLTRVVVSGKESLDYWILSYWASWHLDVSVSSQCRHSHYRVSKIQHIRPYCSSVALHNMLKLYGADVELLTNFNSGSVCSFSINKCVLHASIEIFGNNRVASKEVVIKLHLNKRLNYLRPQRIYP